MELTQAVNTTARYLDLDEPYTPSGRFSFVTVDSEVMMVTHGEGTDRIRVSRGRNGTTRASHLSGAAVEVGGGDDPFPQYLEARGA